MKQGDSTAVLELFEKGKVFTRELLRENENLRMLVARLRTENRKMESQLIRAEIPHMQKKIEVLEEELRKLKRENGDLREQFSDVEEENREFAERYMEVEKQNSDLISLYVASHRLHSILDYEEVLSTLREIIINMIGSECFGIYFADDVEDRLTLITAEGLGDERQMSVVTGEGVIGEVAASGRAHIPPGSNPHGEIPGTPIACIPMKVGEETLGVVVIYSLLLQKHGFEALDSELFEILGNHAATAICAAKLFSELERKQKTLRSFLDLLKADDDTKKGSSVK